MKYLLLILLLVLPVQSKTTLHHCYDGDTCTFIDNNEKVRVRLWGVQCPEKRDIKGIESKNLTLSLIQNAKNIELKCTHGKSYDRKVCEIWLDNQDLARILSDNGICKDWFRYSKGFYK